MRVKQWWQSSMNTLRPENTPMAEQQLYNPIRAPLGIGTRVRIVRCIRNWEPHLGRSGFITRIGHRMNGPFYYVRLDTGGECCGGVVEPI